MGQNASFYGCRPLVVDDSVETEKKKSNNGSGKDRMSAFVMKGDLELVEYLIEEMIATHQAEQTISEPKRADRELNWVTNVKPNAVTFNAAMKASVKVGDPLKA
jgi:hypothetical protein